MPATQEPLIGYHATAAAGYRERLMGRLAPRLPQGRGLHALDLGCGEGQEALWLSRRGWKVEAVDQEAHAQWKGVARESRNAIRFSTGNAQALKRPAGRYDLVFEKDMAHHAGDPAAVFREMARLAKPGGTVVVVEANRLNPIFYLHLTLMGDHQHFTRGRLQALLDQAGMGDAEVLKLEARVWPLNRAWGQRLAGRLQDLAEALPFLRPFLCYHLCIWRKPGRPRRR
jgi:ubiquinone/menaquinone biosynthesis C-methylase UbiE